MYICASPFWIFAVDKIIFHNNSYDLIDLLSHCISQGLWFSLAPPCLLVSSGVSSVLSTIFTISYVQHLKQTLSLFFHLSFYKRCWHRHADRWHPLTFLHSGLPITFVLTSVPATFLLTKSVTLINPTNSASVN